MTRRCFHDPARRPTAPLLEPLEERRLLDGNVAVPVEFGNLVIRGDAGDNAITISRPDPLGPVRVTPAAGTTINGQTGAVDFDDVSSIRGTLGDGDDDLTLSDIGSVLEIVIDAGAGNDGVHVLQNVQTLGDMEIGTGQGNDTVEIGPATTPQTGSSAGGRNIRVSTGEGEDAVTVRGGASTTRDLEIDTGDGNDTVTLNGARVGDDMEVRTGSGDDQVNTGALEVKDRSLISGAEGRNTIRVEGSTFEGPTWMHGLDAGGTLFDLRQSFFMDELCVQGEGLEDEYVFTGVQVDESLELNLFGTYSDVFAEDVTVQGKALVDALSLQVDFRLDGGSFDRLFDVDWQPASQNETEQQQEDFRFTIANASLYEQFRLELGGLRASVSVDASSIDGTMTAVSQAEQQSFEFSDSYFLRDVRIRREADGDPVGLNISGSGFGGKLDVRLEDGGSQTTITDTTVNGLTRFVAEDGDDFLSADEGRFLGGLRLDYGYGAHSLAFQASTAQWLKLSADGGASTVSIQDSDVQGPTKVRTEASTVDVDLSGSTFLGCADFRASPQQVQIQARFLVVNSDFQRDLGIRWSDVLGDVQFQDTTVKKGVTVRTAGGDGTTLAADNLTSFRDVVLAVGGQQAQIGLNGVTAPRLVVNSNAEATILAANGSTFANGLQYRGNDGTAQIQFGATTFGGFLDLKLNDGPSQVRFLPGNTVWCDTRVLGGDGRTDVSVDGTDFFGDVTIKTRDESDSIAITDSTIRQVLTTVTAGDGDTIVIDGLLGGGQLRADLGDGDDRVDMGVAVLSRIPFINRLFGGRGDDEFQQTGLIVWVTPRIAGFETQ